MATNEMKISLSLKEIDKILCPKCKKALRDAVKEKLTDEMVDKVMS